MGNEIFVTESDIKKAIDNGASLDELVALTDRYSLEYFKTKQAEDAEFEVIQPKQLTNDNIPKA